MKAGSITALNRCTNQQDSLTKRIARSRKSAATCCRRPVTSALPTKSVRFLANTTPANIGCRDEFADDCPHRQCLSITTSPKALVYPRGACPRMLAREKEAGSDCSGPKNLAAVCGGTRDGRCRGVRDGQVVCPSTTSTGGARKDGSPQPVFVISIRLDDPASVKT